MKKITAEEDTAQYSMVKFSLYLKIGFNTLHSSKETHITSHFSGELY
jgi:hypothetical protein